MILGLDLSVGWQFDLVVGPLILLAGLVALRLRAVRRRGGRRRLVVESVSPVRYGDGDE